MIYLLCHLPSIILASSASYLHLCVMGLARREKSEMEVHALQLEEDVDSLERQVCVCV